MVPASFASFGFAGQPWGLSACGAVWWPAQQALVVADLHLEKASWFAMRGQMLPPYDSRATLSRLATAIAACGAGTVYCLGDSFHDAGGPARLEPGAAAMLREMSVGVGFVWITGNHDVDAAPAGAARAPMLSIGGAQLVHEARPHAAGPQLSGHFHPKFAAYARGRRIARPCAVLSATRLILPAYGALTGGLAAEHPAIRAALAPDAQAEALIASADRLHRFTLWPQRLAIPATRRTA